MSALLGAAGNFIGVPMAAYAASNEEADLARFFGAGSIEAAKRNPAVRKKMKELDERWEGAFWESIFSWIGGAIAGAIIMSIFGSFLGTIAIPLPIFGTLTGGAIGSFIGLIGGGILGGNLYQSMCEKQAEDPLVINEQIIQMQAAGKQISAEVVFAALAANVSGKAGENVDNTLKRYTGKELFSEVLGNPASVSRLTAMMNNPAIDAIIRAQTGMTFDPQNPNKSVAQQYAELINSGKLNARDLFIPTAALDALISASQNKLATQNQPLPELPKTPMQGRDEEMTRI